MSQPDGHVIHVENEEHGQEIQYITVQAASHQNTNTNNHMSNGSDVEITYANTGSSSTNTEFVEMAPVSLDTMMPNQVTMSGLSVAPQSSHSTDTHSLLSMPQGGTMHYSIQNPPGGNHQQVKMSDKNQIASIDRDGNQSVFLKQMTVNGEQVLAMVDNNNTAMPIPQGVQVLNIGQIPEVPQAVLAPLNDGEEPLYVNAKQYHRILKRREARAKLEALGKITKHRVRYQHQSRHNHATSRVRGAGGKFTKRTDEAKENYEANMVHIVPEHGEVIQHHHPGDQALKCHLVTHSSDQALECHPVIVDPGDQALECHPVIVDPRDQAAVLLDSMT